DGLAAVVKERLQAYTGDLLGMTCALASASARSGSIPTSNIHFSATFLGQASSFEARRAIASVRRQKRSGGTAMPRGHRTRSVRKRGRPSTFTQTVADELCRRLADGETLRAICRDPGMPGKTTVMQWLAEQPEFRDQYARARGTGRPLGR